MTAHEMPQTHSLDREIRIAKPNVNDAQLPASGLSARCEMQMEAAGKGRFNRECAALREQSADSGERKPPCFHCYLFGCARRKARSQFVGPHDFFHIGEEILSVCTLAGPIRPSDQPQPRAPVIRKEALLRRLLFRPL
jgi:hypothetical protein